MGAGRPVVVLRHHAKHAEALRGRGGVVEDINQTACGALLRLDKPGPGTAALYTITFGGSVMATFSFYLYGDQAAGTVAREKPLWQTWIQGRFPMPTEPSKSE